MLPRVLEPEVMDTCQEAVDYDAMDHSEVNRVFVDDFLKYIEATCSQKNQSPLKILDVGTGTAQIPIELCGRAPHYRVVAIDLAAEMLKVAAENLKQAGLTDRVDLEHIDAKNLPYMDASFDAVISNSIVHHIPDPKQVLGEMIRVLRPGGMLFVRDLLRPPDRNTLDRLVATYAGDCNSHQQQMFRDSLQAALTLSEIREILEGFNLPADWAVQTTDRHWTVCGSL